MNIGADYSNAGVYFKGAIDDVRIYNRALSALEVLELYERTASVEPQPAN